MKPKAVLDVYRTKSLRRSQRWAWRIVAENGRTVATSGEGYTDRTEALNRGAFIAQGGYELDVP